MCSNYMPVTATDRLLTFFGVEYAKAELLQREVFPLGMAPPDNTPKPTHEPNWGKHA